MDSLSTGFKFASKLLGMNQSANVANLVAQAFGGPSLLPSPTEEAEISSSASTHQRPPSQSQKYQYEEPDYPSSNERDNLVVSSDKADHFSPAFQEGVTSTTTTTTPSSGPLPGMNGLVGGLLRVLGMDEGKMSALLVNGMIFIAQMVKNGASFVDRSLTPLKQVFRRFFVQGNSVTIAKFKPL